MKKILTIAGSDCSGGAGIQADIKTITAHKMYAMSVITSLTAQNTTGIFGIYDVDEDFVRKQLDAVFSDIRPDAVKIGMVSNAAIIRAVAKKLEEYKAENIVIDPVMMSTSGSSLLSVDAKKTLTSMLIPMGRIVTPNIAEAQALSGINILARPEMITAAEIIASKFCKNAAVLIKGGHLDDSSDDLLFKNGKATWFPAEKIANNNTHGTGCTLSSAIACFLADGLNEEESVYNAKLFITGALTSGLNIGKGNGPLNHCFNL
ncbi:MAG: bifunctional hydroxymethylpyrimidine kinase/phosphomethylpyrimidine kinase [Oscillospiraceae bacterium]